jgi:3-oxoacyl-[acyl-carrier protein] reductase
MDHKEVVIVTGGAKGIGRQYSLALADAGYRVAVADRSDPSAVVEEISRGGGEALGVSVDVADEADTVRMAETVVAGWGRIDGLVNNAGYFTEIDKTPFYELSIEQWEMAHRVNVIGTWLCIKAVFPTMREQGYGKIVNTSSMTVPTGVPGFLHYVASKSAVVGLTRALAREAGEFGVRVNTISPCYIPHDDSYASRQPSGMGSGIVAERALRREMTPDDLVGTMLHLVGHGSDFVTGQDLWVNGGRAFS